MTGHTHVIEDVVVPRGVAGNLVVIDDRGVLQDAGVTWNITLQDPGGTPQFEWDGTDLTLTGTITATAGDIGGWNVDSTRIYSDSDTIVLDSSNVQISVNSTTFGAQGIQLDYNAGTPRAYIGDGVNQYFHFDGTDISWKGTNSSLTTGGAFTASDATITGAVTATSGAIGGWTVTATQIHSTNVELDSSNKYIAIYDSTYGNQGIQLQYNSGTPRAYVGDGSNAYFQFDGTKIQWKGSNSELDSSGNIICTGGTIGGWTLAATTLSSANITIDSTNNRIRSSNYTTGYAGTGFTLESDLLEVGNIACRGIIRTAVFQKDVAHVVGGNLLVRQADVLSTDMTAADNSTLTIEGNETFSVNDVLRIKDGVDDEWLLVTNIGSAPTYTVTRDLGTDYGSGNNPAWKKGASVINYGATGDGGIYLTSSESNAPHISVFSHSGSPWLDIGKQLQLGNLNGFLGYSSALYGIAVGTSSQYLKYEPTNGLRVRGSFELTGDATLYGNLAIESSGTIRTTTDSTVYPYVELNAGGIDLVDGSSGGTYGTATYTTAAEYGFGSVVKIMSSQYHIPWYETKEPQDASSNDSPSFRLYSRTADPAGGSYETGDLAVVDGKLKIYTGGSWTVVGTQS